MSATYIVCVKGNTSSEEKKTAKKGDGEQNAPPKKFHSTARYIHVLTYMLTRHLKAKKNSSISPNITVHLKSSQVVIFLLKMEHHRKKTERERNDECFYISPVLPCRRPHPSSTFNNKIVSSLSAPCSASAFPFFFFVFSSLST